MVKTIVRSVFSSEWRNASTWIMGIRKNLRHSLILCCYSFFKMFLNLSPSDFWQFRLFIGLIIDNTNNIVNNLDRFMFWSAQIDTPIG